jgi:anti-sigma regulatory factor (Ser/Thr protein kinase)
MTSPEHDSAVQRLDVCLQEQERLRERYVAAIGTSAEMRSYARFRSAGERVATRGTWLRWIDEKGSRGLDAGPWELLAEQARDRCRLGPASPKRAPGQGAAGPSQAALASVPDPLLELTLWIAASANAPAVARSALEVLSQHIDCAVLYNARLLATELVTNSVRHSGVGSESSIGLAVRLTPDRLTVVVSDPGPGFRVKAIEADPAREDGRGLAIVDRVAECWGVGDAPGGSPSDGLRAGTTVWFELAASGDPEIAERARSS